MFGKQMEKAEASQDSLGCFPIFISLLGLIVAFVAWDALQIATKGNFSRGALISSKVIGRIAERGYLVFLPIVWFGGIYFVHWATKKRWATLTYALVGGVLTLFLLFFMETHWGC